jgi:hypothetical protein
VTTAISTTTTIVPTTRASPIAGRRPGGPLIGSRTRPQLRGRLPFLKNRNQPETSDESTSQSPSSTVSNDQNNSGVSGPEESASPTPDSNSSVSSSPETANQPSSSEEPADSSSTPASSTERTRGRPLRPLFANRQRSSLFGRRGTSN